MPVVSRILILCLAGATSVLAQGNDSAKIRDYLKSLPAPAPPEYDEVQRLALAANPLG